MSASANPPVNRKRVRLPPLATYTAPAQHYPYTSTTDHANPHDNENEESGRVSNNSNNSGSSHWVDRLTDFAQRQTETAAAAAIIGVKTLRHGTLTALSLMRTNSHHTAFVPYTRRHGRDDNNNSNNMRETTGALSLATAATSVLGDPAAVSRVTRGVVELTEELTALEARVAEDEGYFADVAEAEACVMEHLREWRLACATNAAAAAAAGEQGENSAQRGSHDHSRGRRSSGLLDTNASTTTTGGTTFLLTDASVGGAGGGQRVQADLAKVRQCAAVMADLHAALLTLENEHRGLQRHYIVENTFTHELDTFTARLSELSSAWLEVEEAAVGTEAQQPLYSQSSSSRQRRQRRDVAREKPRNERQRQQQSVEERDAVRASLAACEGLLGALRRRAATVSERLTDELLWMRAEVERHDWSAVLPATPLTSMEAVTVTASGIESGGPGGATGAAAATDSEDEEKRITSTRASSASSVASSNSSRSTAFSHSDRHHDSRTRESFLLRVRVPVFSATTAPPLPVVETDTAVAAARLSSDMSHRPSRHTVRAPLPSSSSLPDVTTTAAVPTVATVSVVATPSRYALVQLYEACREYLAEMYTRLSRLQARRRAEAEQLRRDHSGLDMYDPAADDMAARCASVERYVQVLEGATQEVARVNQEMHVRVKVPLDAALHTYERFRAQLLEVLKQRLEAEDELHATTAAVDALLDGGAQRADEEEQGVGESVRRSDTSTLSNELGIDESGHAVLNMESNEEAATSSAAAGTSDYPPSQERAHRSAQSPQASPSPPAQELPRASAEFIGMLDTLLRSQERAASEAATAVVAAAVATPDALDVESDAIASIPAARHAEDAGVATSSREDTAAHRADRRRPREGEWEEQEEDDTVPVVPAAAAVQESADGPVVQGGLEQPSTDGTLQAAAGTPAAAAAGAAAAPTARGTTVVTISSTSASSEEVTPTQKDEVEESSSAEESGDAEHAAHRAAAVSSEPRRYGLRSEDGFRGGVRAFFAAVARRVMDFSESDSEDDGEATHQERGGWTSGMAQQRKRPRRE